MKELVFGEGLMNPTIQEKKKITIRKFRPEAHNFTTGEVIKGVFKDGLVILLRITADTETKILFRLTDFEAREDGYHNAIEAAEELKQYYPDLNMDSVMAIIRYEILKIEDAPIVSFNEFAK